MDDLNPDPAELGGREASPRGLWLVGLLEAASLAVLLINLLTADNPALAQAIGPIHGLLYLIGIAWVWSNRLPTLSKVLVLIPAAGTLIAARHHTRTLNRKNPS